MASFRSYLAAEGYSPSALVAYRTVAYRFLSFLDRRGVALDQVQPIDVSAYIREELGRYHKRHGRSPKSIVIWRCSFTPAVHALLSHAQGRWPPPRINPLLERLRRHMEETRPGKPPRWKLLAWLNAL